MINADLRIMLYFGIGVIVGYGIYTFQRWIALREKGKPPQAS